MGRSKKQPIFYDSGKRWRWIKSIMLLFIVIVVITAVFSVFAYLYSPLRNNNLLTHEEVDQAIEEINNVSRPVYNQGTFMTIEDIYGKKYIKRFGEYGKKVLLTFDDGPDPVYTEKILDVLDKENVNGTFFVIGMQIYKHPELGKKILAQGSDMGIHTFSHYENKDDLKLSAAEFRKEIDFTEKIFMQIYQYKPMLFRIPFVGLEDKLSYNSLQYIGESYKRGFTISAPTVDAEDWNNKHTYKDIVKLATNTEVQTAVILLHDAGGNREETIKALPEIIAFYRNRGYTFMTVSQLAKENNLPFKAQMSISDKVYSFATYTLYDWYKKTPRLIHNSFTIGFIFVMAHTALLMLFVIAERGRTYIYKKINKNTERYKEFISIIIPMHNEERSIKATIRSILRNSYKRFEVLIVDDGSTDDSYQRASEFVVDQRITVFSKPKGGKFDALNYGISKAKGEIIVCIDADTRLTSSALARIVQPFKNNIVGAVAGNIKVGNRKNLLTKMQSLEYALGQTIEKRVSELFGYVPVVPGAFGAWRRKLMLSAGKFNNSTHAEDFDLSVRIIQKGYEVRYCENAVAYTEAPVSLSQLVIQRLRWNFGNLQVFYKYRSMMFNKKYGIFGMVIFPRFALIQMPAILLTPIVDILIIMNFLIGEQEMTIIFLLLYLMLQLLVVLLARLVTKKHDWNPGHFIFLRFPYSQIMYSVLILALIHALKGEIIAWTKLYHSGKFSASLQH